MTKKDGQYRKLYEYQSLKGDRKVQFDEQVKPSDEKEDSGEAALEQNIPEEKSKENAKRARVLAKGDIGLLFVGAIGAVFSGFVFPAWGILFAYLVEVLYHPVLLCTDDALQCQNKWTKEAKIIEELSYKVTWGWLGTMVNILICR